MGILDDAISLTACAKALRIRRERLTQICRRAGLLIQFGPRSYRVRRGEVERWINENMRVPAEEPRRERTRRGVGKLHRLVRC
jgi:hypothetical protein